MLTSLRAERITSDIVRVIWGDSSLNANKGYTVYFSSPDNKNFVQIGSVVGLTSIEHKDNSDRSYYRVSCSGNSLEVLCENNGDNFTRTIVEDNLWYLENAVSSVIGLAFLIRTGTAKCPSCYNEILKKRTTSDCEVCNGTGLQNSYSGPINVRLGIVARDETTEDIGVTEKSTERMNVWTTFYCSFMAGDCIVIGSDKYVVQEIPKEVSHYTESGEVFVTKQYLSLKKVDDKHLKGIDKTLWTV